MNKTIDAVDSGRDMIYDVTENYDESKPTVDYTVIPERDQGKPPVLDIKGLGIDFGGLTAVDEFTLTISPTEIAGIIGPNGAGKTTFFKIVLGELEPDSGKIILPNGTRVSCLPQVISDEIPDMRISVIDFLTEARPIEKLNQELQEVYNHISTITGEKELN